MGDIEDLNKLAHWHPNYREWTTWADVPPGMREVYAHLLEREADNHAATCVRVEGRPNQKLFEQMWAHVARLASSHLR